MGWLALISAIATALPPIIQAIEDLVKEIQGNTPTAEQAQKMGALVSSHQNLSNSMAALCAANMPAQWK